MRHYRRVFPVNIVRILKHILTVPGSHRLARTNVALWGIATLFGAVSFVLGILAGGWWGINVLVLAVDAVMFRWALTGLRRSRRHRAATAALERTVFDDEFDRITRGLQ